MSFSRLIIAIAAFSAITTLAASAGDEPGAAGTASVESPDGRIRIEVSMRARDGGEAAPSYCVYYAGRLVLNPSCLGLRFAGYPDFKNLKISGASRRDIDETYSVVFGASSTARNHCTELTCSFKEAEEPHRRIQMVFRAYNDGVAFRYRLPEQPALTEFAIAEEASTFDLAGQPSGYALPLGSFTSSYEAYYELTPLEKITADALLGLPLLVKCPNGVWVAILEADLADYAGMYLSGMRGKPGALIGRLSPDPEDPAVKVKGETPHDSPWRALLISDRLGSLIESNLVLNLNPPSALPDTSWITTGKTAFTWWNDFMVGGGKRGGLNTETIEYYIDFCAENGIAFYTLDGIDNLAWYGGPIQPYEGADITTAIPEIDLPRVLAHAKQRGVGLRLWAHWQGVRAHMEKAFPIYERWGIHGVMLDFIDRDDQDAVRFYHQVMKKAAEHHLTISFHGTYKPTGLRRTYPNLLTREAVMSLEYNKWDFRGITPEHELIVPFTRMLAGHLDFHQGAFRHVTVADFQPRYTAPVAMGTRARQLAMYVVYENPLPMIADYPEAYSGQPGFDFVKAVPTTWDETRVIDGAVGDFLILARRKGPHWYLGAMTDEEARTFDVPLSFLGEGTYTMTAYEDAAQADRPPSDVNVASREVVPGQTISVRMAPAGGFAAHLAPGSRAARDS